MKKVPELLDLTRKLLDPIGEIVDDSLPSTESVAAEEVRYSIFLSCSNERSFKVWLRCLL